MQYNLALRLTSFAQRHGAEDDFESSLWLSHRQACLSLIDLRYSLDEWFYGRVMGV